MLIQYIKPTKYTFVMNKYNEAQRKNKQNYTVETGSQSTKNTIERWKNKQNYTVETGSQSTRNTIERWKNKQNYTVGTGSGSQSEIP